ncbi:hypothetical protein AB0D04_01935 [Streptomyces sp. NPDC048483]|uniref:hypothetical protein n=1 Tax=Streptomyces sp. NPDC048483 TaxID=3154927 RepID=UPI00342A3142
MSTPPQQPYSPAPKQSMSTGTKIALGCGIPAAFILLLAAGCTAMVGSAANEASKEIKKDQQSSKADDQRAAKEDVDITSCAIRPDEFGSRELDVKLLVTNNGKDRASYIVEGEVVDQDSNQVTTIDALVDDLNHGAQKKENDAALATEDDLKGVTKVTCKILDVDRSGVLR